MRVIGTTLFLSCAGILAGCAAGDIDGASVGETSQTISTVNRLSFNRLSFNRLSFNRLSFNRLSFNRLSFNRLSFNSLDGLETTQEGREVLEYVSRCALNDGDVLVAEHDGVAYEFPGLLGLAPDWETRALTDSESNMVSACLIAHVNAFGVSVPISLRAADTLYATSEEMADFPVYEGTFFGNVFGEELETFACIGDLPEVAMAHSSYRSLRVCTDAGDECPVISVGRCQDVCETYHPRYGWQGCWAEGVRYAETISAYLVQDTSDGIDATCPAGTRCVLDSGGAKSAVLDCSDADWCTTSCDRGGTCSVDGSTTRELIAMVSGGALAAISAHQSMRTRVHCHGSDCDVGGVGAAAVEVSVDALSTAAVSCRDAGECSVACAGGSRCDIDCTNADECRAEMTCTGGASCALRCDDARSCGFSVCEGDAWVCSDGAVVCNRSCP